MKISPETLQRKMASLNNAPRAPEFKGGFQAFPDSLNLLGHLDYNPVERNQGNCGNCWVWSGTGIMGIALDVQDSIHDRLSIQYLNSNYDGGSGPGAGSDWACCGGLLEDFAPWYTGKGKVIPWSNTNAHWQDGNTYCNVYQTTILAGNIAGTPYYPINYATYQYIDTHGEGEAAAINNIKTVLNQNRAVQFGVYLPTQVDWNAFFSFWQNNGNDEILDFDSSCGKTWINGEGGGHAMLLVGYYDDPGSDVNDYWLILNSWGNDGGDRPQGTYRLKMHMDYDCQFYYTGYGWANSFWFETLDIDFNITPPSVTTTAASGVTDDAATLNGNLTGLGNYGSANVSFEWGETQGGPYPNTTTPEVKNSTGTFNAAISGLDPDTPYYYRAKAVSNPTVYGGELNFTTSNPLVSIDVTPTDPTVALGRNQQFTATGTYSDLSTANITASVAWSSDNTTVAVVGAGNGLAQSQAVGQAVIIATSGAISGNTTLTVGAKVLDSISVTPPAPSLDAGRTQQFTATGTYSDASTANITLTSTWTSSNGTVATVGANTGLATSHAAGTTIIAATSGAISGNTTLTVGPKALDSITVTPPNPAVDAGRTRQFEATGTYSDASTANLTASVAWASDNTTVVTIDAAGLATSHVAGNANITATSGAISGNTTITVGPKVLDFITVTPVDPSIALGNDQQFTATGTYSDASTANITLTATWTSDNTTVATVGANTGLAQSQAAGQAVIIATDGAISGNTTLTVEAPRTLTMIAGANGSVSPAAGPHAFSWGSVVSINATADAGWKFDSWTGDVATVADVSDNTTFITMTGDFTVTANFDQPVLTMAVSGNGSVSPAAGPHVCNLGEVVSINATADAGWEFDGWTGDVDEVSDVNAATTNVTMNADYTITANFSQAVLTMAVNGSGGVTPPVGAHTYAVGTIVDITAVPDAGWKFDGWTGDVTTVNSTAALSTNITMNGDYTVTASFSVINSGGGGGGAGARGVTDISLAINPEGCMVRDITAVSSDLQAYIKLTTGTYCLTGGGTPIFWIYIKALEEEEGVPEPPEGSVVISPYYDIEPEGTTFDPAVAFTLEYDLWGLPEGVDPYSLAVMYWDVVNEEWVALETTIDAENEMVTAYLEHFSLFTVMQWRTPADIGVAEIAVDSHEIYEGGQASVEALLTNSGESAGSYEAVLMVNGVVHETREIAVDGGQSVPAVFELSGLAVGDYTVNLGGSEISFSVLKLPEPAALEVSELSISPVKAEIGDTVEITVMAANTGELEGSCEVVLNINGEIIETREVRLGGGSCEEVVFAVTVDAAGEQVIEVGGLLGNLVVMEKPPGPAQKIPTADKPVPTSEPEPVTAMEPVPDDGDDTTSSPVWLIVVICIGVVAVAGYYVWRRRRSAARNTVHPDLK